MRCPAAMFDELPEGNYDISTFMDDNGDIIGIYIYIFYIILYIIVIIGTLFLGIQHYIIGILHY